MDLYRPVLEKLLFPALEAARGRPTVPLLRFLRDSERWSLEALRELQAGLLRRLIRHAADHTAYYRELLDDRGLRPDDVRSASDLHQLPVLDRDLARQTIEARTARVPRWVIEESAGGTAGAPVLVKYDAEARHWRDAIRWRGYGWGGYHVGMRAMHYWGAPRAPGAWLSRRKRVLDRVLDRVLRRELHVDCVVRSEQALAAAVRRIEQFRPQVIVAYAGAAAALARHVNDHGLRRWGEIPVIVGAERLWPHERNQIAAAFGPAFETYGCREVTLIGAECEAHDGMHTSMENLIVELIVREPGGGVRPARPGEAGEVAITDLHNLACPMIRYLTGDVAIARAEAPCACGRGLAAIGPITGRGHRGTPLTPAGERTAAGVEPAAGGPAC